MKFVSSDPAQIRDSGVTFGKGGAMCLSVDESAFKNIPEVLRNLDRIRRAVATVSDGGFDLTPAVEEREPPKVRRDRKG